MSFQRGTDNMTAHKKMKGQIGIAPFYPCLGQAGQAGLISPARDCVICHSEALAEESLFFNLLIV
jgi:hypothetical protein